MSNVKNPVVKGGRNRAILLFVGSVIVSPLLFIIGLALSPILIGIPIALAAILLPFYSIYAGYKSHLGKCPVCGKKFASLPVAFNCKDCKSRLVIRQEKTGLAVTVF